MSDARADDRSSRSDDRADSRSQTDRSDRKAGGSRTSTGQGQDRNGESGWRSFGDRLAERMQQNPVDRLKERTAELRASREFASNRMPLSEIKESRELVKGWRPDTVSTLTRDRYAELAGRMERAGKTPEQMSGTRGTFKIYRAAAVHTARTNLQSELRERDSLMREQKTATGAQEKVEFRAQLLATESKIREARAILDRYPPGTGDVLKDRERTSAYSGAKTSDRSNGKDHLDKLPPDWRERVWSLTGDRDRDAVAVLALTGARPAELTKGVRVEHGRDGSLTFTIRGAKLGDDRGQKERILTVDKSAAERSAEGRHLLAQVREGHGRDVRIGDAGNFSDRVAHAGERAGLSGDQRVSAYTYRHDFAATLKSDPSLSRDEIATALGQQAERSQEAYGRSGGGRGGGGGTRASASSGTRAGR